MIAAKCTHLPDVFHRHRLSTAVIIRYRQHYERDALPTDPCDKFAQSSDVHIALEGIPLRRLPTRWNHYVNRFGSDELHIRPRGVEVGVIRHYIAFFAGHTKQNALGSTALMSGNYVP